MNCNNTNWLYLLPPNVIRLIFIYIKKIKYLSGGVFATLITCWPSLEDRSIIAGCFRVFYYILWFIMMTKILGFFLIVFTQAVNLRYQFKQLHFYFLELVKIFDENIPHKDKESKFEEMFKFGLKLHAETLW